MTADTDFPMALLAGQVKALEYGMRVLIAAHPNPDDLHAAWQALLPAIAETHATSAQGVRIPGFQLGMTETLSLLSRQIEQRARQ